MNDYIGDPNLACKPECVLNTECPTTQACINQKCLDPCPGTCGLNAECRVAIHRAVCTCIRGFEGDPFRQCYPKREYFFLLLDQFAELIKRILSILMILKPPK